MIGFLLEFALMVLSTIQKMRDIKIPQISSLYLAFKNISGTKNLLPGDNNKNVKPLMLWIYNNRDIFARINRLCTLHHLKAVYDFL